MPKVKARVRSHEVKGGKLFVTLEFDQRVPKISTVVTVHWGAIRSLPQNALYWTFLNWLIEHGGLKDQGHFSAEALHLDLKAYFLAEKVFDKGKFKAIEQASTTTLGRAEFSEYFSKVEEFVKEFFEVDTAGFWKEFREDKPISNGDYDGPQRDQLDTLGEELKDS